MGSVDDSTLHGAAPVTQSSDVSAVTATSTIADAGTSNGVGSPSPVSSFRAGAGHWSCVRLCSNSWCGVSTNVCIAITGVIMAAALSIAGGYIEYNFIAREFQRATSDIGLSMQTTINEHTNATVQLGISIASHDNARLTFTNDEFQDAVRWFFVSHTGILVINWFVHVSRAERATLIPVLNALQGVSGLDIINATTSPRSAAVSPEYDDYYPLIYSSNVPTDPGRNRSFLLDVLHYSPARFVALNRAIDVGVPIVTDKIGSIAVVVYTPVYQDPRLYFKGTAAQRRANVVGIMSMAFLTNTLLQFSAYRFNDPDIVTVAVDDDPNHTILFASKGAKPLSIDHEAVQDTLRGNYNLKSQMQLVFGGRVWTLNFGASMDYFNTRRSDNILLLFLSGLAFTALILCLNLALQVLLRSRLQLRAEHVQRLEREFRIRAVAAKDARDQTINYVCHELRNPLFAISTCAEFLSEATPLDENHSRDLDSIRRGSNQMMRLLNDVLDMASLKVGKLAIQTAPVDLRTLLEDLTLQYSRSASSATTLTYSIDMAVPSLVICDSLRVKQVLANGITNALKATMTGVVHTHICVSSDSQHLVFMVMNTGRGLGLQNAADLFLPFEQTRDSARSTIPMKDPDVCVLAERFASDPELVPPTSVRDQQVQRPALTNAERAHAAAGTGLGLPICHQLVEIMGGKIGLFDQVPFTVFWFKLPYQIAMVDPADGTLERAASVGLEGIRVLVVDDDVTNRSIMARMLSKIGCTTHQLDDGTEVEAELMAAGMIAATDGAAPPSKAPYDVVLMDVLMRHSNGASVLDKLHTTHPRLLRVPFIAVTGLGTAEDLETLFKAGFVHVLVKPFTREAVLAAVCEALGKKQ